MNDGMGNSVKCWENADYLNSSDQGREEEDAAATQERAPGGDGQGRRRIALLRRDQHDQEGLREGVENAATRVLCSKAREYDSQTFIQPCMWFLHDGTD